MNSDVKIEGNKEWEEEDQLGSSSSDTVERC